MGTNELKDIIDKIEERKKVIEEARSELGQLFLEVSAFLDFFEDGVDKFEVCLIDIGNGVYEMGNVIDQFRGCINNKEDN
jgi:hypothetical protein